MKEWQKKLIENPPRSSNIYTKDEWANIVLNELDGPNGSCAGEANSFYGLKHTDETKKAMSVAIKKYISSLSDSERKEVYGRNGEQNGMANSKRSGKLNPMFGKKHTEETKKLISKSKTGKKATKEVKEKLSKIHLQYWQSNPELREKRSEEYKRRGIKPPSSKGLLWWNNGESVKRSKDCPGEGWVRGRRPAI